MAAKAKRVVEKGFAFKTKVSTSTSAPSGSKSPKAADKVADAPRLSGSKRRGNTVGFIVQDDDVIHDVAVDFSPVTSGPHRLELAVTLGAVNDYAAAAARDRGSHEQPAYFVEALSSVADMFAKDAPKAVAALSGTNATTGYRNPKNIDNAKRLAFIKQQLRLYGTELEQWKAAAARHAAPSLTTGARAGSESGNDRTESLASAGDDAEAADDLEAEDEEGRDGIEEAPGPFLATALSTALALDRVAQRLVHTGAAIDAARSIVAAVSVDVRQRAFEGLRVPSSGPSDGGGLAPAAAATKALLRAPLMPSAAVLDAGVGGAAAAASPPVQAPPTRTPQKLSAALLSAAAAAQPPPVPSSAGKRPQKRGGAVTPAARPQPPPASPEDDAAPLDGRPSVPAVTPKIIKKIRGEKKH